MGDHPRPTRRVVLVLVVAIAGTGLVGYLISRPPSPSPPLHPPPLSLVSPSPSTAPPTPPATIGYGYGVAYDQAAGQLVVFGGSTGTGDETWIWNGSRWTVVSPATHPPALLGAAAAYDPALRMVMLFGGQLLASGNSNATWGWNGETWHELNAGIGGPPPGSGAMAWDGTLDEMVLVSPLSATSASKGQTWIWAKNAWIPRGVRTPFLANDLVLDYDVSAHTLMAVSCCTAIQTSTGAGMTQTWRWDGSRWQQLVVISNPTAAALLGLVWDAASRSLLLGVQQTFGAPRPVMLWRLASDEWVALNSASDLNISSGDTLVDTTVGVELLVGADNVATGSSTPIHMWSWTGTAWKLLG
jgi:hypothetical protein